MRKIYFKSACFTLSTVSTLAPAASSKRIFAALPCSAATWIARKNDERTWKQETKRSVERGRAIQAVKHIHQQRTTKISQNSPVSKWPAKLNSDTVTEEIFVGERFWIFFFQNLSYGIYFRIWTKFNPSKREGNQRKGCEKLQVSTSTLGIARVFWQPCLATTNPMIFLEPFLLASKKTPGGPGALPREKFLILCGRNPNFLKFGIKFLQKKASKAFNLRPNRRTCVPGRKKPSVGKTLQIVWFSWVGNGSVPDIRLKKFGWNLLLHIFQLRNWILYGNFFFYNIFL